MFDRLMNRGFIGCWLVLVTVGSVLADASQEVLLVVFSSNDAACRRMAPLIDELVARDLPILRVDAAQSPELVAKYNITTYPTLIALANGQEVDRVVGSADPIVVKPRVVRMFEQAKNHVTSFIGGGGSANPPASPSLAMSESKMASSLNAPNASSSAVPVLSTPCDRASVRLKVTDQHGFSWGTGTIIDTRQGSALVLTCGHIFRDSRGMGAVEVHIFQDGKPYSVAGRCLRYNLENDLALVEIRVPATIVGAIRLAPEGHRLEVGQSVASVGCDGGDAPTARQHFILSLDKIATPPSHQAPFYYIQVSGAPVSGRSGGGLFTDDGYIVGVCNTADPLAGDGHFVPAHVIRSELDAANLGIVYREPSHGRVSDVAANGPREPQPLPPATLAAQTAHPLVSDTAAITPAHFLTAHDTKSRSEVAFREGTPHDAAASFGDARLVSLAPVPTSMPASSASTSTLSPHERSTLQEIQRRKGAGDEVIIIVRPRGNAQAPSDVIVLQGVSDPFLAALAGNTQP